MGLCDGLADKVSCYPGIHASYTLNSLKGVMQGLGFRVKGGYIL